MTMESNGRMQVEGEAILFGFPSTKAVLSVQPRPQSWRASGAAARMGGGVVMAGMMAIVPPHAPWIMGWLVIGAVMAHRRWTERYTLQGVEAKCPKCGADLSVKSSRLRRPHPVSCEACHFETRLTFPEAALPD
jgi:predicted RNA-binding Zn-ribbon protein involved in translation (DUF1610 family)